MAIAVGDALPDAKFIEMGADGPGEVALSDLTEEGKIVVFAVPGAYTPTCSVAHVPSFVRTAEQFKTKGFAGIYCVAVNDPFVMKNWGEGTGAEAAGIRMLADPEATFTKAIGMEFSAPPVGLLNRSKRYAMVIEDGRVTHLNVEDSPGTCEISAGETLLAQV